MSTIIDAGGFWYAFIIALIVSVAMLAFDVPAGWIVAIFTGLALALRTVLSLLVQPNAVGDGTVNDESRGNRAQRISASCAVITAYVAAFGVYTFWDANQRAKIAGAEAAIARLYPYVSTVGAEIVDMPNVRNALYHDPRGEIHKQLTPSERCGFDNACGALADIMEYYLLVRDNIAHHPKGDQIIQAWDNYLETMIKNSFGLRGEFQSTRVYWAPMLRDVFDRHAAGLPYPASRGDESYIDFDNADSP